MLTVDMKAGVYRITNKIDGKVYIGSSSDTTRRIKEHLRRLRKGNHTNGHLQNAWNRDGESVFSFAVVEACNIEETLAKEQLVLDNLFKTIGPDNVYNFSPYAYAPRRGTKHSVETRKKIGDKGRGRKVREETKRLISIAVSGTNAPMLGKKHGEEARRKISLSKIGRKRKAFSEKTRLLISLAKRGPNNPNWGKKLSEETKSRMSVAHRKWWRLHPHQPVIISF